MSKPVNVGVRPLNPIEDAYPMTTLQKGMVFHSERNPNSAIYHDIVSYHLEASLDLLALQTATRQLLARHSVLRTSFNLSDFSEPLQLVHRVVDVPLQVEDLRPLSPEKQTEALTTWIEAEKSRRFDWGQAPLLRFQVHRCSEKAFQFTASFHHAILDGWSVASMFTELFHLYFSLLGKETHPIQSPPTSMFRDFVALERKALESDKCRGYWMQKLNDCIMKPLPRWPSSQRVTNGRQIQVWEVALSSDIFTGAQEFARTADVPLKSVLLAAHLRVLSLLTGESDVLTGLVSNGRPEVTDSERALGLFLNTLPFRVKLRGGAWIDLVRETFETEQELLPFRWYPMAELQRIMGRRSLFETKFNFTHFHVYRGLPQFEDVQVLGEKFFGETNFDLGADFNLNLSQMGLTLTFNAGEFCDEQVKAIGDYYVKTLTAMINDPFERYDSISLISTQEQYQLLTEWNDTEADYPKNQCIHELFEAQVRSTPDSIAVVFGDESLTYQKLNCQANQLARHLRSLGVGPEVPVGICVERSLTMVVGLLGILKAGGAYLALDPEYPKNRLVYMLEDAQVNLLLTHSYLADNLSDYTGNVLYLDGESSLNGWKETSPQVNTAPENLAYISYTSGSTGQPKGILSTHKGVVNYLTYLTKTYDLNNTNAVLQLASLSFDASVRDIIGPLTAGGQVVVVTNREAQDPITLLAEIKRRGIDCLLSTVPTLLRGLLEAAHADGSFCPSVQLVLTSGETLHRSDCRRARGVFGSNVLIVNQYGPTECTMTSSYYQTLISKSGHDTVLIGRPIPNSQFYVLDKQLNPVPIGVVGEIYIGGVGLARGYANRPNLTAEKFIPHPFSDQSGERLFKTGDLACYLPDGNIEFWGRVDHQVKIRGFRVELGEIEAVLGGHAVVREAVVVDREDVPGEIRLVAYVVPYQEQSPSVSELRAFLKKKLPGYMIPSTFMFLDVLPLTPNRKIDRRKLPIPGQHRPELAQAFVAPSTPQEKTLAEIWSEALGVEQVGVHDNFFDLGGDSLKAMRVTFKANQAGLGLTIQQIFEHGTIAQLVAVAGAPQSNQAEQGVVTGKVPFTHTQVDFLTRENRTLNIQYWTSGPLLRMEEVCDLAALEKTAEALVRHHDILRLCIIQDDSGWRQFIAAPDGTVPLKQVDLSAWPEVEQGDRAVVATVTKAAIELLSTLDMAKGPLFQLVLFTLGPHRPSYLLLFFHYLIADPTTWQIVGEDLYTAYRQLTRGEEVKFPPKTTSYKYFAERVMTYAQSTEIKQEAAYWLAKPWERVSRLPKDYQRGTNNMASLASVVVNLTVEETQTLIEVVSQDVQVQDVLLTALVLSLMRWTGTCSLLIAVQSHGRVTPFEEVNLTRTAGWHAHRVPVLLELETGSSLSDALRTISEQLRDTLSRGIGCAVLRYLCEDEDAAQSSQVLPQAEIVFNYFGEVDRIRPDVNEKPLFKLVGNVRGYLNDPQAELLSLLNVQPRIFDGQMYTEWLYSENLYQRATVEKLASEYLETVRSLIPYCRFIRREATNRTEIETD